MPCLDHSGVSALFADAINIFHVFSAHATFYAPGAASSPTPADKIEMRRLMAHSNTIDWSIDVAAALNKLYNFTTLTAPFYAYKDEKHAMTLKSARWLWARNISITLPSPVAFSGDVNAEIFRVVLPSCTTRTRNGC